MRRAAEEEGALEGAVLRERIGTPGLEVGTELAGVAFRIVVLLEVFDGDWGTEKEKGLSRGRLRPR